MATQVHSLASPTGVGVLLARLDSAALRLIATTAIDLLDERDGDCDIEDDDPAGDTLDEHGEHPTDDATAFLATSPRYAADQSLGPTNVDVARQSHRAMELGLTRNARGGWSRAA